MTADGEDGSPATTGATPAVPGRQRPPLEDALVIDPRDPLGLGDLRPGPDGPDAHVGDEAGRDEPVQDAPVQDEPDADGDRDLAGPDEPARVVAVAGDAEAPAGSADDAGDDLPFDDTVRAEVDDSADDEASDEAGVDLDHAAATARSAPVVASGDGEVPGDDGPDAAARGVTSADEALVSGSARADAEPDGPSPDGPSPDEDVADVRANGEEVPDGRTPGGESPDGLVPVATTADEDAPPHVPATPDRPVVAAAPVRPVERSAWTRLAHAMRPRITTGQLLTAALCALLGLALVVQVRQTTDAQLGSLRQDDLVRLLDETTTRADELAAEAADLQRERDELLSGSDRQQAALDAARRNAATQGILTGRLPATGAGVRVTLHDADPGIRPATMLHVLEELRNAGAEAIQLNDMRVTASSAFTGTAGAVLLDGVMLSAPYRWLVIGDPDTIATALEIPGGAIARVRSDGGRGTVERLDRVDVTALRDLPGPVHATPVPGEG